MTGCTKETKCLVKVLVVLGVLVPPAEINSFSEEVSDHTRGGSDAEIFRSNVVLHTSPLINAKLCPLIHRTTQAPVVLPRIDVVRIVFRVVNVLFWAVAAKSFCRNFKLAGAIAKAHETENPE